MSKRAGRKVRRELVETRWLLAMSVERVVRLTGIDRARIRELDHTRNRVTQLKRELEKWAPRVMVEENPLQETLDVQVSASYASVSHAADPWGVAQSLGEEVRLKIEKWLLQWHRDPRGVRPAMRRVDEDGTSAADYLEDFKF